jgi:hypothetical protein
MMDGDVKSSAPQGLQLFFAMYAVTLVFGIEQISDALYKNFKAAQPATLPRYLAAALFISVLFLIIRFFWSTGNLKRAWQRTGDDARVAPLFLVIHLPALLMQGVLVLFLCFAFVDRVTTILSSFAVIFWFIIATGWNALWLVFLGGNKQAPESFWIRNNGALVLFGVMLLIALQFLWIEDHYVLMSFIVLAFASSILDLLKTSNFYLSDIGR